MSEIPIFSSSPELDDALVHAANWGNEVWVHNQFRWLRENDPIRRLSPNGYEPFWCLSKYKDILHVESNKELFVNEPRPILAPQYFTELMRHLSGRRHLVRSLVVMDAPDHMKYRMLTQGWFMRGNLRQVQQSIQELATEYIDRMEELGDECDFVKDIAVWFPLRVIMSILGVPAEDIPLMMKLTQEMFGSSDPDTRRSFEMNSLKDVIDDFDKYFEELTVRKRKHPTNDVASLIANAEIDGKQIPQTETNGYYIIIATAGHDTTSSSIAGGLLALIQHRDQLARLKSSPEQLMSGAVNEMIRWVTPVRQFMRTTTHDCVVGGQEIPEGDSLALWYPSANRDDDVFEDPDDFKIDREGSKHLAFGYGAHVCLGQHLARMEMEIFFTELLKRVGHIELAGTPRYSEATFVGGLKSLPIQYKMV